MTDITSIPLNKLVASEDNVRRTAVTDASLQELAASIAAHGLLQSLVARNHCKGKFVVVAGGRRLAALQLLAEQGRIDASFAVPCQVRDDDATELSLDENVLREPMSILLMSSRRSAPSLTAAWLKRMSRGVSASPKPS